MVKFFIISFLVMMLVSRFVLIFIDIRRRIKAGLGEDLAQRALDLIDTYNLGERTKEIKK